ncbi:MAG: hypothetical protein HY813_01165 [Candidatus Portnoybacteria bacterium]|nr:hypothetical protein [Candidatus Portnoybacteria bacterium]
MLQSSENDIDRWRIIKNWFYDNQADIVLVLGVILVALIGFGLGRLTTNQTIKEPVVIESQGANALNNIKQTVNQDSAKQNINGEENKPKGIIVASKNGKKYHWPWCSWAKKIKPENQVWFKSELEAKTAGYEPCATFYTQAPAGYKPEFGE